jgi:nucleotide-binding universal stress UspA family protein
MKVLAAIDATTVSAGVLRVAKELARVLGADVDAVHVVDDGRTSDAEAYVRDAAVPLRLLRGPVESALVAEAREDDAEAVVVGLRGTVGASRPLGHVALHVIDRADAIVVAVPPHTPVVYELRTVLVPIQGRPADGLERVVAVARDARLDLVILHVHDGSSIPAFEDRPHYDLEAWADEFLTRWVPGAHRDTLIEVRVGVPEEEVTRVCRECGADMIAMGWEREPGVERLTTVRATLERSSVPVALLPVRGGDRAPDSTDDAAPSRI